MPEGPELHLASLYVNKVCEGVVFTGTVTKSEVSKSPEVPFTCEAYLITAVSRGKEVKLTLTPLKSDGTRHGAQEEQPMDIVFRFGMSGYFTFTTEDELPKHAHLRFYSEETPCRVLSFVDTRRFGSWEPNGTWHSDRGPCIMFEYERFRENVVTHLSERAFDRPICEVLLNQKYFNGIGNYLRAEILFRLKIPPFVSARTALEGLQSEDVYEKEKPVKSEITARKASHAVKKKAKKEETGDLLRLCHTVPLEVVNLGSGKGYDPTKQDYSDFEAWLQCYYVDGMNSVRDHNGRTMWFKGDAGPMAPKDLKSPKAKKRAKTESDHGYTDDNKKVRKGTMKKELALNHGSQTPKKEEDSRPQVVRAKRKQLENKVKTGSPADSQRRSHRVTRQTNK